MTATANTRDPSVLVANHRRFAAADDVLSTIEALGSATADTIADHLDVPTRDVVAALNFLAGRPSPLVTRAVENHPIDDGRARAARWDLAAAPADRVGGDER